MIIDTILEGKPKTVPSNFDVFGAEKIKMENNRFIKENGKKAKVKIANTQINDVIPYYIISEENTKIKNKKSKHFKYDAPPSPKEILNTSVEEHICNISYMDIKIPSTHYDLVVLHKNSTPKTKNGFSKILNKIITLSNAASDKIEGFYDFVMHYARLYDFRNERLIGVDIKADCIYLCQIGGFNGKRILNNLTATHIDGGFLVQDIAKNSDEYVKQLTKLLKENNITTKNAALSIPASNAIVKTIKMPILKRSKISKALKSDPLWSEIIGLDTKPEDYSIFYQVTSQNKPANSMNVLFIATKLSDINLYTNIVKKSGLNPVIVDVHSSAIKNAYSNKIKKLKGSSSCVFLEFGLEENYAMIIDSGKTTIKQIDVNETHKMVFIDGKRDEKIIDEFLTDYSRQVQVIIDSYLIGSDNFDIKKIFVLSSVTNVSSIIAKLSEKLENYSLQECNIFDCMKINDNFTIPEEMAQYNLSSWAASIGMALKRVDIFGNQTENINHPNMLPHAGRYAFIKRINYQLQACATAAAIVITFVSANLTIELNKKTNELSTELAKFGNIEETYKDMIANYTNLSGSDKEVTSVIEIASKASQSHKQILSVYQYLNLVILDDVWIRELSFIYPNKVKIIGGSDNDSSILEFIQLLNDGGQFEKVALKGMKEIRETNAETFMAETVKTFQLESTISNSLFPENTTKNLVAENVSHGS